METRYRGGKYSSIVVFVFIFILCVISMIITAILIGVFDLPMVNSEHLIDGNPRK